MTVIGRVTGSSGMGSATAEAVSSRGSSIWSAHDRRIPPGS